MKQVTDIVKIKPLLVIALFAGVAAATSVAGQSPADASFWVTLADGSRVPYDHPLARGPRAAPSPSSTRRAPSGPFTPSDPEFWVILPDGSRVPYDHPAALSDVRITAPASAPAAPMARELSPADPGFWVTLPNGQRVPYNHELALALTAPAAQPSTAARAAEPAPAPAPAPEWTAAVPVSAAAGDLRVLSWNIQHGVGTDGRYDIERIANVIAASGANIVSLNEVERYTGWGNEDQPARFAALLSAGTGRTWNYHFAQRNGASTGQGNLVLSTYHIEATDSHLLSWDRSVARVELIVNGIRVNVFSTHLDAESASRREQQMSELLWWAGNFPEQRIYAGDFNAWPGAAEISTMKAAAVDTWATAQASGTAVAYPDNPAGNTRNGRIDYVWYSVGATRLIIRESRVFDTRAPDGVMPSDHRPVMTTLDVG